VKKSPLERSKKTHISADLLESNDLLENIFSNIHVLIAQMDIDFNFVRVNRAFAEADGHDPEFYGGKNHFELFPYPGNESIFRQVLETGKPVSFYERPFEYAHHPERGVTYWDWTLQPIKDEIGVVQGLVLSLVDRTKSYKVREELALSEWKYRMLVEQASDGIAILDQQLNFIDANTTACEMTGLSRKELLHLNARDVLADEELLDFPRHLTEILSGEIVITERKIKRKNNGVFVAEISAKMLEDGKIQLITRDITARKEEENKNHFVADILSLFIKKSSRKEYLDAIVHLVHELTGCKNVGIRIVNDKGFIPYESFTGFSKDFMKRESMLSLATDSCACIRVIAGKREKQDAPAMTPSGSFYVNNSFEFIDGLTERQHKRSRGNCIRKGFSSIAVIPIRYLKKPLGALHIADERTDMVPLKTIEFLESTASPLIGEAIQRFNMEVEIRKAHDELELRVQKRTEELGKLTEELKRSNTDLQQFAYAASHDLQAPLRNVEGFTKLFERRYQGRLDTKADEFIHFIIDGVKNMQTLINDLLEYSQVEIKGKKFKVLDSSLSVAMALANLQTSIEENNAEIVYDENLPKVLGDPSQLSRLFQNLIANAIKFRKKRSPKIKITADRKEDEWIFAVHDNGIGIDQKYWEKIFVIFQRLHGKVEYQGTGIGLAICKRIVERHGGHIWVESQPRKGTTFFFTLPYVHQ
jgi:PAS domain S-box-containing protein